MASFGQPANPNNDAEVSQPPSDSISALNWSPVQNANFMAVSSWDKSLRCLEISAQGQSVLKAGQELAEVPLDCAWSGDGARIFAGGCDGKLEMWDLGANRRTVMGQHQGPISTVNWIGGSLNMVVTGSWDRTIKYWDGKSPNPVASIQLPERVYCADVRYPLLVAGTADNNVNVVNLQNPGQVFRTLPSPLRNQMRCVKCFVDSQGFIVGSIEGRCGVQYLEQTSRNFTFKCHRENSVVYPVNSIAFHPLGTFATTGADGTYTFWDKDSKQRLKHFLKLPVSLGPSGFNSQGTMFAYAASYDWSKGRSHFNPNVKPRILLHPVTPQEIKPRPKQRR